MSNSNINLSHLAAMLRTKRGSKGLREIAVEIGGVSASTLSRIEQENLPDLETFAKICKWLKVPPTEFINPFENGEAINAEQFSPSRAEYIEAHLRADRVLPRDTVEALSKMIHLAYTAVQSGDLGQSNPQGQ